MRLPRSLAVRRAAAAPRAVAAAALGLLAGVALVASFLLAGQVRAQGTTPAPPGPPPQATPVYSSAQLDQMLAPIALYPDDLLGQILMAATYPLEIVQADRWLQLPGNASLHGPELAQALQQQPWDASVKALVAFPQVLSVMDNNLQWTEELGEAFLAQQADVMDRVQQLRSRAQAARTLNSTPQQTVTSTGQAIEIAPATPDMVYVPVYDPDIVYGEWPYPDYLPYYFDVPGYALGSFIGFAIIAPWWGWDHWDWAHHRLNIGGAAGFGTGGPPLPLHPGPWRHDPQHRAGVPYRSNALQTRFSAPAEVSAARENFRGFSPSVVAPAPSALPAPRPSEAAPMPRAPSPVPQAPRYEQPRFPSGSAERPTPPAMESFGGGAQVRMQEQRGAGSRMSVPSGGGGRTRR